MCVGSPVLAAVAIGSELDEVVAHGSLDLVADGVEVFVCTDHLTGLGSGHDEELLSGVPDREEVVEGGLVPGADGHVAEKVCVEAREVFGCFVVP